MKDIGYEVARADELKMERAKDKDILQYAGEQSMVIITMDLDFGAILALSGVTKPSVITFRLKNPNVAHINGILKDMLPKLEGDLEEGAIITVEEERVRVRKLPIKIS